MMRLQTFHFAPNQQTPCVFPYKRSNLLQAISQLGLKGRYPVIVLVGGRIEKKYEEVTHQVIHAITLVAQALNAVVICGGTDMGVMAEIGLTRRRNHHKFPLLGIAPETMVSWPRGPQSTKFFWWGRTGWKLEPYYTHFILVPGSQFGAETPWIDDAAALLSNGQKSVTILINGGKISRKDIELSLQSNRPVIIVSGTGRLADELAGQVQQNKLITVLPANAEQQILDAVQSILLGKEENTVAGSI